MENLPSKNGSTIQAGWTGNVTNGLFEVFALNYPFWNHELTDEQVAAKKRLWATRLQNFTPEAVNEAVNEIVASHPDKSGPTLATFLDIATSLRRARQRESDNDRIAQARGYESWDALCRDQRIGIYYEASTFPAK